jgi:hypothetical protein
VSLGLELRFLSLSVVGYAISDGISSGSGDVRSGTGEADDKSAGCSEPTI